MDDLLGEVGGLVNGPRADVYGHPSDNFRRIAALWTAYLDGKTVITPVDAALMQALIKVARLRQSSTHRDSWLDLAGYAGAGWEVAKESE
jgi:hypothetical protein